MDQFDKVMDFFRSISIPRYTGTPENEKVQNIIQSAFSEIKNVKIEVQQFNISHVFMNGLLCIMHPFIGLLMMLVFLLIFLESFTIAFILNIFLLIIATFNRQILDFLQFRVQNLGKQIPSSNIIATIEPEIESEQTQNLVFLAHYDSISHVLFDVLESIGYLAALLGGVIFSIHTLIYLIPVILFTSSPDPIGQLIWGLPFALLTFIELFNSKGNKSQGVIDNGSGLAQIYHLALVLSENKLKNTRVVLVATGAEEQGDYGAYYFVQKYKSKYPPETTKYIISDSIGVEKNLIVYGIGLPKKHWSPSLEKTAREIASEDEYPLKFIAIPPLLAIATDHVAVVPEKYEFLLFASMTSAIHTNKDTFEALDENKYRQMLQFIENFVRKIDEQEIKTLQ